MWSSCGIHMYMCTLTLMAHSLHSFSLLQSPAAFNNSWSNWLALTSNHFSCFSLRKERGSVDSWLPKTSSFCNWTSSPKFSGRHVNWFLLRSIVVTNFRSINDSWKRIKRGGRQRERRKGERGRGRMEKEREMERKGGGRERERGKERETKILYWNDKQNNEL